MAAASIAAGLGGVGCGLPPELPAPSTDVGSVNLEFGIAKGLNVSSFDYEIEGNGFGPVAGTIPLGDPGASVSAFVGGLPAGARYQLTLSATTDDQGTFCDAVSAFDVVPPVASALEISMVCVNANTIRTVDVGGTAHVCPEIGSTTVARSAGDITLSVSAFSFDDDPVSFHWEAQGGALVTPEEAVTAYACDPAGSQRLRVTASNGSCSDVALLDVACSTSP